MSEGEGGVGEGVVEAACGGVGGGVGGVDEGGAAGEEVVEDAGGVVADHGIGGGEKFCGIRPAGDILHVVRQWGQGRRALAAAGVKAQEDGPLAAEAGGECAAQGCEVRQCRREGALCAIAEGGGVEQQLAVGGQPQCAAHAGGGVAGGEEDVVARGAALENGPGVEEGGAEDAGEPAAVGEEEVYVLRVEARFVQVGAACAAGYVGLHFFDAEGAVPGLEVELAAFFAVAFGPVKLETVVADDEPGGGQMVAGGVFAAGAVYAARGVHALVLRYPHEPHGKLPPQELFGYVLGLVGVGLRETIQHYLFPLNG